jgi:hypothetical protein
LIVCIDFVHNGNNLLLYYSEEDINIKHLVNVWLKQQATAENIAQLIEEHFFKGVLFYY